MKLFIAEKPSLAKEIAFAWAQKCSVQADRGDGFWSVGQDKVTWLFGHMLEQCYPEDYDPKYKNWDLSHLPIIPEDWKLKVSKDKKKQVTIIKGLLKDASEIINAGDAGREGQLLVDELVEDLGYDPFGNNCKRLWVSSVTRKDLLIALSNMKPNADKKTLYQAALARSRSDWLHGLNMTRLYTIKARQAGANQLLSVGRVQTPTLRIVVERDLEIENFVSKDFYVPTLTCFHQNGEFTATWVAPEDCDGLDDEGRLIDKKVADQIANLVNGQTGTIEDYKSQKKTKSAPLPFSLSALQSECSKKFGLSAKQTLDVAQSLYETHKVATYPRTDSRYLPQSIYDTQAAKIIDGLKTCVAYNEWAEDADLSIKSSVWNDKKVSDHHAIIPTTDVNQEKLQKLSEIERKVFDLIAKHFLAQFFPVNEYLSLSTLVAAKGHTFKATGSKMLVEGWKVVFKGDVSSKDDDEEDEEYRTLPEMKVKDTVTIIDAKNDEKKTKPPARFTDGTLITAMSSAHRFVQDPDIKKRLRESDGLGTEATRASILETLIARKFIQRKKKQVISTQTGRDLIKALPDAISSPELSALWEGYLSRIVDGKIPFDDFMREQHKLLKKRVEQAEGQTINVTAAPSKKKPTISEKDHVKGHGEKCEKCGEGQMLTRKSKTGFFLGCSNYPTCKNAVFPDSKPKAPSIPKEDQLPDHGKGCGLCNKGTMVTRRSKKNPDLIFLACSDFDCKNVIFPERA